MSYVNPGFEFAKTRNPRLAAWDGRVRLFENKKTFPIGLLSLVQSHLDSRGEEFRVVDVRDHSQGEEISIIDKNFVARDYQQEVVDIANNKKSGVIRMCTGSGKTSVIAMLSAKFNVKTIIYVIGIELLYQMKETIERLLGVKCGMIGDGVCDISDKINICTIWTAARAFDMKAEVLDSDITPDKDLGAENKERIQELVQTARMFILDECQYAGSSSLQMLSKLSINARFRFLLSGTPWREMGDDILIEAVSGPKIYDLPATKLIDRGVLVPPKIYFINVPRKRVIGKTYAEIYNNFIVHNEERNDLIVKAASKLVSSGRKVLILISKVEHGNILYNMLSENFRVDSLNGSTSSDSRMNAIKMMKESKLDILIASKIFDQGIDIPELDALILAGSGKSSARALQRVGRVIRWASGKKWANVIEFWDNAKYLEEHSKLRLKIYRSEPGFQIKIEDGTMSPAPSVKPSHEISWEKNDRRRTIRKNPKVD
jgi:superfamily II DNA or RNA helicase